MLITDPVARTVRTITETCTRDARESRSIEQPNTRDSYRRLSIRERATFQGVPNTFQFYGASHGQKLRMLGNAIPPAFSYLVAQSFLSTPGPLLPPIPQVAAGVASPTPKPDVTDRQSVV